MKIGELAQMSGVTQSAIRFYVSKGMLVPDDTGAQMSFGEREIQDLEVILRKKKQQFSLEEIQDYLCVMRHSNMIEPDTIDACIHLLDQKRKDLGKKIHEIQAALRDINEEIRELNSHVNQPFRVTGVPVSALSLLACPHCGRPLRIERAEIEGEYILSGTLRCSASKTPACPDGCEIPIENGIIKTGNLYTGSYDTPDMTRGLYRNMKSDFSAGMQKCADRIVGCLKDCDLSGKVLLEANVNGFFFLYQHLDLIPEDCLCIIVDKYPEMLEMYKALIEQMNKNVKILYIADAATDYPLKSGIVDIYVSFFGESEWQLYHANCYLTDASRLFREDSRILGAYIDYEKGPKTRKAIRKKYPEGSENCNVFRSVVEQYENAGFRVRSSEVACVYDSGVRKYSFECHAKGEPLRIIEYEAVHDANKPGGGISRIWIFFTKKKRRLCLVCLLTIPRELIIVKT